MMVRDSVWTFLFQLSHSVCTTSTSVKVRCKMGFLTSTLKYLLLLLLPVAMYEANVFSALVETRENCKEELTFLQSLMCLHFAD